jgi:pyrimidine-nucleoside phosphorylase
MQHLVAAAHSNALDDQDVADLSCVLAASGAQLLQDQRAVDVASTGGPSSLSTLLCPLQLRSRGLVVAKLGVSGRPAGGVDVLQTIPGFRATLEPQEAKSALRRFGYIHLVADSRWTPLDAKLFAYRQANGAQGIPALVIASILAKKLAAGTVGAGLEIRVAPHGNFGGDLDEARANAHRYNAVARLLDLRPVCILTDATRPYQPYIGRGEALLALADILDGRTDGWLTEHNCVCQRIADAVGAVMGADVASPPEPSAVRAAHELLLQAHGAQVSAFEHRVELIRSARRTVVQADRPGAVAYDLGRLRDLLVSRQRADRAPTDGTIPDPAGVILGAPAGTHIEAGETLISVRVPEGEDRLAGMLASCAWVEPAGRVEPPPANTLEII